MPRKIYNDEELREKALKLRAQGLTYREIAEELGCSVYKVHEVLSPHGKNALLARVSLLEGLHNMNEADLRVLKATAQVWFNTCRFPDEEGYCTRRFWTTKQDGLKMKPEIVNGETRYRLNAREHVLYCLACPYYRSKGE